MSAQLHDSAHIKALLPDDPEQALGMLIDIAGTVIAEARDEGARVAANEAINRVLTWMEERAHEVEMGDRWHEARMVRGLAERIGKELRPWAT